MLDPVGRRVVLFGGALESYEQTAALWSLPLTGAPTAQPLGDAPAVPGQRSGDALLVAGDAALVVHPPRSGDAGSVLRFRPGLSSAWERVPFGGAVPPALYGSSHAWDPSSGRVVGFGGENSGLHDSGWTFGAAPRGWSWEALAFEGPRPAGRVQASIAIDPVQQRMYLFGGFTEDAVRYVGDTWSLDLRGGAQWTRVATAPGAGPSARAQGLAVWDAPRGRMVLFGGYTGTSVMNDVWSFTPAAGASGWARLEAQGSAPDTGTTNPYGVYDATEQRLVVSTVSTRGFDVSALDLAGAPRWTALCPGTYGPAQVTAMQHTARGVVVYSGGSAWRLGRATPACAP